MNSDKNAATATEKAADAENSSNVGNLKIQPFKT